MEEDKGEGGTLMGVPVEIVPVGGDVHPPEENADLPGFPPERAHLSLKGVYGDFLHQNDV